MKNDNDLFYLCSLIEFIGRRQKLRRADAVAAIGDEYLNRIYRYADVFHCEPIAKTADDFIDLCNIGEGDFDNVADCRYTVPDYWDIGEVYSRLIEDNLPDEKCSPEQVIGALKDVYFSWISDCISRWNSDFYYQSRGYIKACYDAGEVLD